MTVLLAGLALFWIAHFGTTVAQPMRAAAVARFGELGWKVLVALALIGSIWLMVRGYREASAEALWVAPAWGRWVVMAAMLPVLVLYMGSYPGSAIRARVRHPQLAGFSLWALLHLLVNGEVRANVLFGGLLAWGIAEIWMLNRRDGTPLLPEPADNVWRAWAAVPIGVVAWGGLMWVHAWLGVAPWG